MTISTDGAFKTSGKLAGAHGGRLDADVLEGLLAALKAVKITADAQYRPEGNMADGFHYTLKTGGHTVRWEDGAKLPPDFAALAKKLGEAMAKAREGKGTK